MKIALTISIALSLFVTACSNPSAEQSNKQLSSYQNDSAKFKAELAKELSANPGSFTYTLGNYFVKDGKDYLKVNIARNNFKTTVPVLVNNWQKIEGIKRTKGMGYAGAELKGLKLALCADNNFEYKSIETVVD